MYFEKSFISEADAFKFCMGESVNAFKSYEEVLNRIYTKPSYMNFINAMPSAIANSIADNAVVSKYSVLNGHFMRDIARNIAETEVMTMAAERAEYGMPMQIVFDKKGDPIGDAAIIANGVLSGLECVQRSLGEMACIDIDPNKIRFSEMSKISVSVSPESGVVPMKSTQTQVVEKNIVK